MLTACDRAGDVRRAEEWTTLVGAIIEGAGNRPWALHTHCRVAYGSVLSASGRWPEAEALMLEALGPADSPTLSHRALNAAHLAELRLQQGRLEEAADLLAPYEDRVTSCGPLARLHQRRGEPDLAPRWLRQGLDELVGDVLRAGPLLATWSRWSWPVAPSMPHGGGRRARRDGRRDRPGPLRAEAALAEGRIRADDRDPAIAASVGHATSRRRAPPALRYPARARRGAGRDG